MRFYNQGSLIGNIIYRNFDVVKVPAKRRAKIIDNHQSSIDGELTIDDITILKYHIPLDLNSSS